MKHKFIHKVFALLYFAILFDVTVAQNQIAANVRFQIDEVVAKFMSINQSPSLGLAVLYGDELYTKGYGLRDIEANLPADSFTLYALGSLSKIFTATIIVKVLNEKYPDLGESALDTPVRQLIPSYNFTLSDRFRSENTNLRDLLSHRVGLFQESASIGYGAFHNQKEFLYGLRYAPEKCGFRTNFVYNHGHVTMAADIIAHIANSSYDQLLTDLLTDIGMEHTTIIRESDDHNNMENRSVPYLSRDGKLQRYHSSLLKSTTICTATGGILSNLNDMTKFMQFHLNHGKVGTVQVIPKDVMQWLRRPSNVYNYGALKMGACDSYQLDYAYALGLNLGSYDGWSRIGHGGWLPPYDSILHFYPELKIGIFTITNGPFYSFRTNFTKYDLSNQIFDAIKGASKSAQCNDLKAESPTSQNLPLKFRGSNLKFELNKKQIAKIYPVEIVGNFGNGMSGQASITLKENSTGGFQPYLSYGIWGRGWMRQIFNSTFAIHWESDSVHLEYVEAIPEQNLRYTEFSDADTFIFVSDKYQVTTEFKRNQTHDTLKAIPWISDNCNATH